VISVSPHPLISRYGINQQSEVKSDAELIAHCQMVVAIREDLGR
jgi:hypothetical protein